MLRSTSQEAFAASQPAAAPMTTQPGPDNALSWTGNGHKYLLVEEPMTWDEANAYAQEQGGYLASVTSAEKQAFIKELLASHGTSDHYWLGGNRVGKNWQWTSGESWGYTNWMGGFPQSGSDVNKLMLSAIGGPKNKKAVTQQGKWVSTPNSSWGDWGTIGLVIEWNE